MVTAGHKYWHMQQLLSPSPAEKLVNWLVISPICYVLVLQSVFAVNKREAAGLIVTVLWGPVEQ